MSLKDLFKRKVEQKSVGDFSTSDHECFPTCEAGWRYISESSGNINCLQYNDNFVYACVRKIEQYISSIPIHMYYWSSNPKKMITPYQITSKNFKNQINRENRIDKKSNKEMIEIEENPLIDLLEYPAPDMAYSDWIGLLANYLLLTGNALLEIVKENNQIKYLIPLKWECVNVNIINGKIQSYQYNDPNNKTITYLPDQVIHIKNVAPGHLLIGKSNLEACRDSAELYKYYDRYQLTLANNYALPGVSINVKNKISNEEEARKIADKFMTKFARTNNGKPLVSFGDIEVKPMSFSPKDLEYQQAREWSKKVICAVFGVPEDLVDVSDSNRASSITAINSFKQITIQPLLSRILDQINRQLVTRFYDSDAFIWYDITETLDNDPAAQAQLLKIYIESGLMSKNEARSVIGLESIEGGDFNTSNNID